MENSAEKFVGDEQVASEASDGGEMGASGGGETGVSGGGASGVYSGGASACGALAKSVSIAPTGRLPAASDEAMRRVRAAMGL